MGRDRNCRWNLGLDGTDPTGPADRWRSVVRRRQFWSHGIVTDYTPTRRFAYAEPWPIADHMPTADHDLSSVTPIATEFLIESASGGSCVIRVVTSAYGSGADWENEFFAEMIADVIPILDNLATHFNEAT